MNEARRNFLNEQADDLEHDIQAALAACDNNPMRALQAAIIANSFLMEENETLKGQISTGFVRQKPPSHVIGKADPKVFDHTTSVVVWQLVYQLNRRARIDLVAPQKGWSLTVEPSCDKRYLQLYAQGERSL